MAFVYNISTSKKDIKANVCLQICHLFYTVIDLFLSTFLVAYIYDLTTGTFDYIYSVGMYNLFIYIGLIVFYLILAPLVDKTSRVWFYRVGIVLSMGLVVLCIFCGKQIASLLMLAGFLNGMAKAFYYSSYNTIKQEMVSRKSMKNFAVYSSVLSQIVRIVVPIIMGSLISASTYSTVAIYVVAVCVIQLGVSFGVKSQKPKGSSFSIKGYVTKLKQNPEVYKKLKFLYFGSLIYGSASIVSVLLNVCIMLQFGSSFSLGVLTSVFSIVAVVSMLLINKFTSPGKRNYLFIICMILPAVSAILFACMSNYVTLIIYNLFIAISKIVAETTFDTYRNSNLKEAGLYSEITEHQTINEIMFNISRIIVFSLLILIGLVNNLVVFKVCFVIFACSYTFLLLFLLVYEKRYCSSSLANVTVNTNNLDINQSTNNNDTNLNNTNLGENNENN